MRGAARHVITGCEIRRLERRGTRSELFDGADQSRGDFDLVVIADGAVSDLRSATTHTIRDTSYPWGALWFVAADPDRTFTGELYQIGVRAKRLYGVLPTGVGPRGETPVASLFWSLPAAQVDAWRAGDLDAWKAEVRALDPRIDSVLSQIHSHDQVTFARYRDVAMRHWHDGNVVFIGDAAHATSPQLGQGANLALLDAAALADAVLTRGATSAALELYSRTRRPHLRHYQRMTRWLTPFFQSDSQLLGWLRDWTFPIANAIAPLRKQMILTMAGVALGIVTGRLALPAPHDPSRSP
jgi:2-polyprenyl-6-methoxyphenol hydroxylase-like FAD-dependent oxidoreductase